MSCCHLSFAAARQRRGLPIDSLQVFVKRPPARRNEVAVSSVCFPGLESIRGCNVILMRFVHHRPFNLNSSCCSSFQNELAAPVRKNLTAPNVRTFLVRLRHFGLTRKFHSASVRDGRYICDSSQAQEPGHQFRAVESETNAYNDAIENADELECETKVNVSLQLKDSVVSSSEFWVVNFYHFTMIADPHLEVARHTAFLQGRDVHGRIYLNEQGINAQLSSRGHAAIEYAAWVKEDSRFADLFVQTSPSPEGHAFPRLRLRYKPSLVQVEGGTQHLPVTDPRARAVPLSPSEWSRKLDEANVVASSKNAASSKVPTVSNERDDEEGKECSRSARHVVLLDVRNGYEWDVGHFKGAQRPNVDCFKRTAFGLSEEEDASNDPLAELDKEAVDVMMYCTGGIRCDVYSTMLRAKGYKNLYSLKGGISNYLKEEGSQKWAGNLFVFDSRLAVSPAVYHNNKSPQEHSTGENNAKGSVDYSTEDTFARCRLCDEPLSEPRHRNCANLDCNQLYLSCEECLPQYKGCCSDHCSSAPKLRPLIASQQYERWHNYRPTEPKAPKPADYVSRRAMKRRRRKERRKESLIVSLENEEKELRIQNV